MPIVIKFLLFAFAILQQPTGHYSYVSSLPDVITQYQGGEVPRLLAHNDLAGEPFAQLVIGDTIEMVYADKTELFVVTEVLKYRWLYPNNFDLPADTKGFMGEDGVAISGRELYNLINNSSYGLVLQTCFDGNVGRLFVMAVPYDPQPRMTLDRFKDETINLR